MSRYCQHKRDRFAKRCWFGPRKFAILALLISPIFAAFNVGVKLRFVMLVGPPAFVSSSGCALDSGEGNRRGAKGLES